MVSERPVRSGAFVGAGLVLLTLLAGCSSGGGGSPDVSFSFASSAATLLESDGPTSVTVVLHTTLPALDEDVTIDVVDAATGTATSAADYAAFAPVTITFPTGAVEGATQTVTLDPLDDSLVDGASETVRLRLQNPSRGGLANPVQHVATLTDIHTAYVGFATAGAMTGSEAAGPQAVALELDCGPGVTIGPAVSVRVSDLRTGTALPGSDYSSFAAQTVTFPAGSADGAVQTVNLTVIDDGVLESDETIELGLSQPSSACLLGSILTHELTIQDDDLAGNPAFAASEGASGTENALVYDELVALGSQNVGAGPNAGTLLRVTNAGGGTMDLGAPSVAGSHPNDFAVDLESSSTPLGFTSGLAAHGAPAPLVPVPDGGPGKVLAIDAAALHELRGQNELALHGIELPGLGAVTLELVRQLLPIAPDAKLAIDGEEIAGGVRTLVGELQHWSGAVAGFPDSRVFLALTPGSAQGFVELPQAGDRLIHVVSDAPGRMRFVSEPELLALGFVPPADICAGQRFAPGVPVVQELPDEPPTANLTIANCRLAIETDWQFFQKFGSSALLTSYVTGLIGAVSDQYRTDVQATLSIAYLNFYTTSNDGWTTQETGGADVGDLLDEFRADWGSSWPATADLAHFLSGATLGGGVAYVNVLCNQSFGFGVSANLGGNINWLTWTGASGGGTWDFVVTAHELGHNFGSQHTHDYCPPLDHCYANCDGTTACPRGTIMSYCHTCGGLANIDLYFHPVTANIMRQRVNASCMDDALLLPGDFVQYRVRFNPLTNTGARSANLQFTHDATNVTQPFRVQLAGTAN